MAGKWAELGRHLFGLLIISACVTALAAGASASTGSAPGAVTPSTVTASVSLSGTGQRIPRSFFGISVEYKELGTYEAAGPLFDRVLGLIRPQDGSRLLLRVGGRSADEVYWDTPNVGGPGWIKELTPAWLDQLASLVRRDRLHVDLDLNLAVHSPKMEVAFARAAAQALPAGSLAGFAIGNEPDLYRLEPWLEKERSTKTVSSEPRHWTDGYTPLEYRQDYRGYVRPLLRALPGTPITAPEITFPSVEWPTDLANLGHMAPSAISIHRYATATCKRVNRHAPTVYSFLKDRYTGGLAKTLGGDLAFARAHNLDVRVTEMNSVTCGGRIGIANSFATALWAPDALFSMMRDGVYGINWHIRPKLANAPFHISSAGIEPLPELYGLLVFERMIGRQPHLENVDLVSSLGHELKVWAVRSSSGLRLLMINKSSHPVDAHLQLPSEPDAVVSRLLAPKLSSSTGVTFAGQTIGPDARLHGSVVSKTVSAHNGTYRIKLPPYTASLVEFPGG